MEKKAFLEGVESCWDSPGIGVRKVIYLNEPTPGFSFVCEDEYKSGRGFITTPVKSVKKIGNEIRFRTENSTYILTEIQDA